MTTKKTAQQEQAENPADFDWLSLSQPTHEPAPEWKVQKTAPADTGPWWVQDQNGAQYATYVLLEGLKPLDESPFNRSGELRTPIPGGTDTAPAD